MDPVTISSLLATAAGALGSEAVKDVYQVTKQAIKDLFGQNDNLLEALEDVETKPQSWLKQKTLQGQIERTNLANTPEFIEHLAKLEALLTEKGLYSSTVYSASQPGSGGLAQGPGATAAGAGSVAVGGDVNAPITIHPTPPDPVQKAKHRYLERLINEFQILPLAAMGGGDELKGEVTLDQVYIELDTKTPLREIINPGQADKIPRAQRPPGSEEREVYTALDIVTRTKKVLLLGGPGSGKSTFAKELCAKIAQAQLNNEKAQEGWEAQTLPLFLTLRHVVPELSKLDLTCFSSEQQDHPLAEIVHQAWLKQFGKDQDCLAEVLEESLLSGHVLLVFDGVDEVPVEQRSRVYQAVMAVFVRYPKLKHVILTCRSRSYTGPEMLPGFVPHHLAPFNENQIRQFVQAWYAAQPELDAERRKNLIQDLQNNALGPLAELSPNPMLLTTMAVLHRKGAGLPKERVRLYDLAVTVMLQRWEKEKDTAESRPIRAVLDDERRLRGVLEHIAHFVHEMEGGQESREGLDRYLLLKELEKPEHLGRLAEPFLNYVDQRAGLLTGEGGGEGGIPQTYRFPHRTFQEYLAGCRMVKGRSRVISQVYRERAGEGDYWSAAAQLGAEELYFNRREDEDLLDLVYDLCSEAEPLVEAQWRSNLWAGMVAVLLGEEMFVADKDHPRNGGIFFEKLKKRLVQLMRMSPLPSVERVEAGRYLAKLGDPRFRKDAWWLPGERLLGFVEIPAGPFHMGKSGRSSIIDVPYTYYISRYPVTVAQFQSFIEDGGYQEESYWPEAKAVGLISDGMVQGRSGTENRGEFFGLSNLPVVDINWYEALAYCHWLTQKLRLWDHTPEPLKRLVTMGEKTGNPWSIMLPNEPEWDKAARGIDEDRSYPWGEESDPNRANYDQTNINMTSTVGCFPEGKSPYDLEEMSGNVWEWTRSVFEEKPYPKDHKSWFRRENLFAGGIASRVLRGGSWVDNADYLRFSDRFGIQPQSRNYIFGFRVVFSPFSSR